MRPEVAVLALLAGCARAQVSPPLSSPSPLLEAAAPSFHRATLQGGRFDSSAARGQMMVVEFFASHCAPCRRSLPDLEAWHRRRGDVVVVGVSLDETSDAAEALVRRYRLTFPVVYDSGNVLAGRFRVTELPASFVIDRDGRVAWAGLGEQPPGTFARAVDQRRGR
jgi:peroxiredoxin